MKYSIATNFDNRLIEEIAPLGTVSSVYGKLIADNIGGGRPSYILPKISFHQLKEHITVCHNHGIRFNYLFNSMCMGNREVSKYYHKIFKYIDKIIKTGIDCVTIANTNFLRMFHENYPEIPISTSIFMDNHVKSDIVKMEELGATEITLSTEVNRNFNLLKKLVQDLNSEMTLRLIANNVCVHRCIDNKNHSIHSSHSSQSKGIIPAYVADPYKVQCDYQKIKNPTLFISSNWIRPEDVHFYDEIGKDKITLKLTDRSATTDWLMNVIKAYSAQKTNGNLLDILNFSGNRKVAQINKGSIIKGVLNGNINKTLMKKMSKTFTVLPVYIDNDKLDGFLEGMQEIDCSNNICNDRGWINTKNTGKGCSYCRNYALKALKIDEKKRLELVDFNKKFLRNLYTGKLF